MKYILLREVLEISASNWELIYWLYIGLCLIFCVFIVTFKGQILEFVFHSGGRYSSQNSMDKSVAFSYMLSISNSYWLEYNKALFYFLHRQL